jgi:hypothetical protein
MEVFLPGLKTQKCFSSCQDTGCGNYHSLYDYRRSSVTYSSVICLEAIKSGFCTDHNCLYCINYTEYLYHPQVYKKKECISSKLGSICPQIRICPYFHKNENLADFVNQPKDVKIKEPLIEEVKESIVRGAVGIAPEVKSMEGLEKASVNEKAAALDKFGEGWVEGRGQGGRSGSGPGTGAEVKSRIEVKGNLLEEVKEVKEAKEAKFEPVEPSRIVPLAEVRKRYVYMQEVNLYEDRFNEFKECRGRSFDVTYACGLLANYVSAFLNTQGGTIYYGISDSGYISGVKLMRRTRDLFTQSFDGILNRFNPPVGPELYSVSFSPVYSKEGAMMQELYIIEIEVKIGDKKRIYYTHKQEAYIKRDSSVNLLKGPALVEFAKNRDL